MRRSAQCPRFLGLQPSEQFAPLLSLADIHLLSQRIGTTDLFMPSRPPGMLASGRPVVATCAEETELAAAVRDRGFAVLPGDVQGFAKAIRELTADPAPRARLGANANRYAQEDLSRDKILGAFERALEELLSNGGKAQPPVS